MIFFKVVASEVDIIQQLLQMSPTSFRREINKIIDVTTLLSMKVPYVSLSGMKNILNPGLSKIEIFIVNCNLNLIL